MKTPRTDVAFDKGYAAGFHFGMDAEHNPYKQYSKYHAWEWGLYMGKQDKEKSRKILKAYEAAQWKNTKPFSPILLKRLR